MKTYSSGMYMRLGFAVAIHVDPDVLLVDEVLAVGDEGFTHKCLDKFAEFRRRNKTILLVTHSLDLVEKFCDEALWLDSGETQGRRRSQARRRRLPHRRREDRRGRAREGGSGEPRRPQSPSRGRRAEPTRRCRTTRSRRGEAPADMFKATEGRWGTREVEITERDAARRRRRSRPRVPVRRADRGAA